MDSTFLEVAALTEAEQEALEPLGPGCGAIVRVVTAEACINRALPRSGLVVEGKRLARELNKSLEEQIEQRKKKEPLSTSREV